MGQVEPLKIKSIDSLCVHAGWWARTDQPIVPPVSISKIPEWGSLDDAASIHFAYARSGNPTTAILEERMAELEGSGQALAFPSGSSAIATFFLTMEPGGHIILGDNLYGGTEWLAKNLLTKFLKVSFVDTTDIASIRAAINKDTKWIFVETPTNPLLKVVDLKALEALSNEKGVPYALDSTFATPVLLQGFDYGAKVIIHASSKYLNGHNDLLGGVLITTDQAVAESCALYRRRTGAVTDPRNSSEVLRGLETLAIRMEKHCDNAVKVAQYLEGAASDGRIGTIYYPGLVSHPQHGIAQQQMKGYGGVISFEVVGDYQGFAREVNRTNNSGSVIYLSESLGGVQSLLAHPATMSHRHMTTEEREAAGIKDNLFRLSVGIENPDDIIASLQYGLDRSRSNSISQNGSQSQ